MPLNASTEKVTSGAAISGAVGKAASGLGDAVGVRHIGLDVQDGGAIQEIDAPNLERESARISDESKLLDRGDPDGVRPIGRAAREDADALAAAETRRSHRRAPTGGQTVLVKDEEDPDMRETLESLECLFSGKLGQQLHTRLGGGDQSGLARDPEFVGVGRANVADGCEGEGHALACCLWVDPIMLENAASLLPPASGFDLRNRHGVGVVVLCRDQSPTRQAQTGISKGRWLEAGGRRHPPR
jgi:hypothetical protein